MSFSFHVVSLCTARRSSFGYIALIVGGGVIKCCSLGIGHLHPSRRLYVRAALVGIGEKLISGMR